MNFEPAGRIHRTKRNGEEFACATIIETHEEKEHRQECLCHYWPGSGGVGFAAAQTSKGGGGPPNPSAGQRRGAAGRRQKLTAAARRLCEDGTQEHRKRW